MSATLKRACSFLASLTPPHPWPALFLTLGGLDPEGSGFQLPSVFLDLFEDTFENFLGGLRRFGFRFFRS